MQNIRFESVLRSNSRFHAIYEYTKIVYPLPNFLCVKSMKDTQENIIPLAEKIEQFLSLTVSENNKIITIQRIKGELFLVKYINDSQRKQLKLNNSLKQFILCEIYKCYALLIFQHEAQKDSQVILVDLKNMKIKAVGFMPDLIHNARFFEHQADIDVTILIGNSIKYFKVEDSFVCYQTLGLTNEQYSVFLGHEWINNQFLLVFQKRQILIYSNNKLYQNIQLQAEIQCFAANNFTFYICQGNLLTCFFKKREKFQSTVQVRINQLHKCHKIQISPSQNMLLLSENNGTLVSLQIVNDQNKLSLDPTDFRQKLERPPNQQIISVISNKNAPYLVLIQRCPYKITVYNSNSHQILLTYQIILPEEEDILGCMLHPTLPHLAVSFNNIVKVYCIMFSELKELYTLPVKKSRQLTFNNNGSIICCLVGTHKGTKVHLYHTHTEKFIETLWVGTNVVEVLWSSFDNIVYVITEYGYNQWNVATKFKDRKEVILKINPIKGALYDRKAQSLSLWTEDRIYRLEDDKIVDTYTPITPIKQILMMQGYFAFAALNGNLFTHPVIDLNFLSKSKMVLFKQEFQIMECKNKIVCVSKQGEIVVMRDKKDTSKGDSRNFIIVDREILNDHMKQVKYYENQIMNLSAKVEVSIDQMKKRFLDQRNEFLKKYKRQFQEIASNFNNAKEENNKLENALKENNQIYELQQMKAIAELEKLYDRKLALTTNKLLTSEEINYRNTKVAENNLRKIEEIHSQSIDKMRQEYFEKMGKVTEHVFKEKEDVLKIKKEYEERLLQLEEQYELVLKDIQIDYDAKLKQEQRQIASLENKYTALYSEKQLLESTLKTFKQNNEILSTNYKSKEATQELYERKIYHIKKESEQFEDRIKRLEQKLVEYEYKVKDLEKTKQILTFRVIQTRNLLEPKQQVISKLQGEFVRLEQQLEKTLKENQFSNQKIQYLQKQIAVQKSDHAHLVTKDKKLRNDYDQLINRIYEIINHVPSDEWNKCFMKLYEDYCRVLESNQANKYKSKTQLEELNRVRVHLEHCLDQVVISNEKIHFRKSKEFVKKINENAQLIYDVNDLRRKLKDSKTMIQQKNREIEQLKILMKTLRKDSPEENPTRISRRIKTEMMTEEHRVTKNSFNKQRTFYRKEEDTSATKTGYSRRSKRIMSATKGIKRGSNFDKTFMVNTEANKLFEQEREIQEYKFKVEELEKTVEDLKFKLMEKEN